MSIRPAAVALCLAAHGATGAAAWGSPLDEPLIGGPSFSGPTTGNLAAVYWNPAAVGLLTGHQITVAGWATAENIQIDRASIDPETGAPGGSLASAPVRTSRIRAPEMRFPSFNRWPAGPRSFLAASPDTGDRFRIAIATYTPFFQQASYPAGARPAGDGPTRYHALDVDLRHVALVPALAIRIAGDLRIGAAPGFLFSSGRLRFDEDTTLGAGTAGSGADCGGSPCGVENPLAAARYDIASGHAPGDAGFAVTFAGGIYYRRRSLEIGLSYTSRPLSTGVDGVRILAGRTRVERPERVLTPDDGEPALPCPDALASGCIHGEIVYGLPDFVIAGVGWRPIAPLKVETIIRYLDFSQHDRIETRLVGTPLSAAGLPQTIVLYRGFRDVWDARVRLTYSPHERVSVGGGLRVQNGAPASRAVGPAAVDGWTVQPSAMAEARVLTWLIVGAGYGLSLVPDISVRGSAFDPTAAASCTAAGGDLGEASCRQRLQGAARPTTEGTYRTRTHTFGLSVTTAF